MQVEHVTIHPPVWCHGCGLILVAGAALAAGERHIDALCAQCATQPTPSSDRRSTDNKRLRELVEAARLLAYESREMAEMFLGEWPESSRFLRRLADATDSAIEALRINDQED